MATLASIETDLERTRAGYSARAEYVKGELDELLHRLRTAQAWVPTELNSAFALLDASLHTLVGRFYSRTNREFSLQAFHRAVELFERYQADIPQHKSSTRFLTDWGIALHRVGRTDESIALLSRVCEGGVAPAEAFGYLGYGELAKRRIQSAEAALRQGLKIEAANLTMSYYLARVLEIVARESAAAEDPEKRRAAFEAAVEAYCWAGEIALNLKDYSSAGRDGLRALRLDPGNDQAAALASNAYRSLKRDKLALLILERFLEHRPKHPGALASKAVLLREMGDARGSIAALRSILGDPTNPAWVKIQLAISLMADDPPALEEATEVARQAAAIGPAEPFTLAYLGYLLCESGEFEAALSALSEARKRGDTSEETSLNLSRALLGSARYEEAEKDLTAVIATNPRSVSAHALLAQCAEYSGRFEKAIEHYRKAARLAPDDPTLFLQMVGTLDEHGFRAQAVDELESRLSGRLRHLALWCKGRFEIEDEEWESAVKTLELAVAAAEGPQVDPWLAGILVDYGKALRHIGAHQRSGAVYLRAYELDPSRQDVLFGKAVSHSDSAEFEQGAVCVQVALDSPTQLVPRIGLLNLQGWCLQHMGNTRGAARAYEQALELSEGKDPWSRKGLGNAMMNFDRKQALEHFALILQDQMYQLRPEGASDPPVGNPSTLGLLGWCHYRLGQCDEAIRLFKSALETSPGKQSILFDLALTFLSSGRTRLAIETFARGYQTTRACEVPRQRGLYYVALFDLADARRLGVLPADANNLVDTVKGWLRSTGVEVDKLPWLANDDTPRVAATPNAST